MTFKFIKGHGRADFGNLGAEYDIDSETEVGNTGKTAGELKSEQGKGDLMSTVTGGAGVLGSMGDLCSCANKDKEAENAKKGELAKKYPTRDCGSYPTAECTAYNQRQQAARDREFEAWQKMKDAEVAANMAPSDAARFQFVSALAKKLKDKHPEAGNMTLAQIYKTYPESFDAVYAELQAQFPFLKNIDAATALAMNPGIANLTLDQLIAKTDAISGGAGLGGSASSSSGSSMAAVGGIAALVALGAFVIPKLFTRRK